MKKERKPCSKKFKVILTSSILTIVAAISVFSGFWFGYTDPNMIQNIEYEESYSAWMSNLTDDAKITEIVIPGSHDAATNGMMPQAICQGHDIIYQLKAGVRYFDLRVTSSGDDLVMFHGPIKGQKFSKVLDEFKIFMNDNPSEFLILDFQHLGDGVNSKTIGMIKDYLPMNKMLNAKLSTNIDLVTMKSIRENHKSFMIIWNSQEEANNNNFYFRNATLKSDYDGAKHKESDEALIEHFNTYYAQKEDDLLFVLQAQRTAKTLLGKPSMYERNFKPKVNKFIKGLKTSELLEKTNIIMRDFVASDKENIDLIVALNNAKGLIKK